MEWVVVTGDSSGFSCHMALGGQERRKRGETDVCVHVRGIAIAVIQHSTGSKISEGMWRGRVNLFFLTGMNFMGRVPEAGSPHTDPPMNNILPFCPAH